MLLRDISEITAYFSLKIFMVVSFTFNSLINFQFILAYVVIIRWSFFIILYTSVQFSQYHLLKGLSLPHFMFLPPLSNIN